MLKWAIIFAVIAIIAGLLGFTGISAGAAKIAKLLFGIFLLLFLVFVVLALLGIGAVAYGHLGPDGQWWALPAAMGVAGLVGVVIAVPALRLSGVYMALATAAFAVVLDNLAAHKDAEALDQIHAAGAEVWFLPPYSPDLNPIEKMWSKIKEFLRAAKARTFEALLAAIADALKTISAQDACGWFESCGYMTCHS